MFKPKLFTQLKGYDKETFFADANAGLIVGIVAIPLAIAFAIASGVSPEQGLITAVIAGFLISFFGGSRVQIGGPTGAFVILVYGIVREYGQEGLIVATFMAGIILVIMGLAKFGSIIKFVPYPVIVGFTSGIGVVIFSTQINDFFGMGIDDLPANFIEKWTIYLEHFAGFNFTATALGLSSLIFLILWRKIKTKVPGSIIVIIVSTLVAYFFNLPVETIGSKFGEFNASLPMPSFVNINFELIQKMILPATTIAVLCAIESLLSAVVADGMIGGRHRSNTELVAQGIANVGSAMFGGIPATGAIARTVTNIKSGAKTPVAGIIHSIVLLLILLFLGEYALMIPMTALAAILIVISYNMFEWKSFAGIFKNPRSDLIVMLTTFGLTVIFDLTLAIEIGMLMSVFLFMRRMSLVSNVGIITRELSDAPDNPDDFAIDQRMIPEGVLVYEINGPFFFGAANKFKESLSTYKVKPKIIIIRMRNVPAIDSTGIHFLEELHRDVTKSGTHVVFSGMHAQPYRALEQMGFLKKVDEKDICANVDIALARASEILKS
ncbi:MAG: sodium-independent anion transporter [Ignavibacteriae bacterium HGW-Ignavibacteriae-1]|jgi:SulP family sulfate permease|nr:MAG: sodium-independent anion transporter [Ignavibacteriae bacterium HGW-Ignavibacteriae-1]